MGKDKIVKLQYDCHRFSHNLSAVARVGFCTPPKIQVVVIDIQNFGLPCDLQLKFVVC